ncbi:3-hydroxy-3-methylglutaryl coenzyme A reductase 1 [Frankliniella fusca]|uniref:3-hydroxy-3-methylglutaryl coenzyme A reductase 1 n=1 Tax=Frankliniella fusca TaxID=407009 RepID=A0AAE1H9T9_9NEOP|nr:3-hydroxy-3-methylglutaryl coenzyme A reductase 1 [Frankliniella fusca]
MDNNEDKTNSKKNPNRVSPYKKVQNRNANYFGYVSTASLDQNKAYLMSKLIHTSHSRYGEGELVFLSGKNQQWKTQVPTKYLSTMSNEEIEEIRKDVESGKNPHYIFRNKMADGSFRVDLIERDSVQIPNIEYLHKTWTDVPELPTPTDETDEEQSDSGESAAATLHESKWLEVKVSPSIYFIFNCNNFDYFLVINFNSNADNISFVIM